MNIIKGILTSPELHLLLIGAGLLAFGASYEPNEEHGRERERRVLESSARPETTGPIVEDGDTSEGTA